MAEITTDRQSRLELVKNAVIYQINLRVFTKEGTLAAAEKFLPEDHGADRGGDQKNAAYLKKYKPLIKSL